MFIFNDPAAPEIYTLSLHTLFRSLGAEQHQPEVAPALRDVEQHLLDVGLRSVRGGVLVELVHEHRSEEHTSELQSRRDLVCRLLLEKKNPPRVLGWRHSAPALLGG